MSKVVPHLVSQPIKTDRPSFCFSFRAILKREFRLNATITFRRSRNGYETNVSGGSRDVGGECLKMKKVSYFCLAESAFNEFKRSTPGLRVILSCFRYLSATASLSGASPKSVSSSSSESSSSSSSARKSRTSSSFIGGVSLVG